MEMSDDALIRLENLRALNIGATELVKSVGSSYQYWRDLMAGKKSFGEKAARRIEEGVGLPRGSLDVPGIKPLENLPEAPATPATSPPTDINVNRRAPAGALAVLNDLRDLLERVDPENVEALGVMLAGLVKNPNRPGVVQAIAALIEPEAFTQEKRNYG